jgi:hypothetical protein
MALINQQNK